MKKQTKQLVLVPALLVAAIWTTAAGASEKQQKAHKGAEATMQKSTTIEGADNFYKSDRVTAQKVTFQNQYQMKVVGNLFLPKASNQYAKSPAIIVGHPM